MEQKKIVFFDGLCNLCSSSVQTILKYDKGNKFVFASLQGTTAADLLKDFLIANPGIDSIIMFNNGKIYTKSTAVLKIASQLAFPLNCFVIFLVIPAFIRNYIYDIVASKRYKWFGKKEVCWLPDERYTSKFLP
ncbi:MAG: DCC1-like thiol-disulfide oxidoreductase family protein [Bacteroidota bacterium]